MVKQFSKYYVILIIIISIVLNFCNTESDQSNKKHKKNIDLKQLSKNKKVNSEIENKKLKFRKSRIFPKRVKIDNSIDICESKPKTCKDIEQFLNVIVFEIKNKDIQKIENHFNKKLHKEYIYENDFIKENYKNINVVYKKIKDINNNKSNVLVVFKYKFNDNTKLKKAYDFNIEKKQDDWIVNKISENNDLILNED